MNYNLQNPAFPCMPIQDNLGRLVAPIPGMTKFEYAVLQIVCAKDSRDSYATISDRTMVKEAIDLVNEIFKQLNEQNEKVSSPVISMS
jgi:hypothetical protein